MSNMSAKEIVNAINNGESVSNLEILEALREEIKRGAEREVEEANALKDALNYKE